MFKLYLTSIVVAEIVALAAIEFLAPGLLSLSPRSHCPAHARSGASRPAAGRQPGSQQPLASPEAIVGHRARRFGHDSPRRSPTP